MKRVLLKCVVVFMCILFLPYLLTLMLTKENTSGENVDEYLAGAIAASIPLDCEMETLKAQTVIMRTLIHKVTDKTTITSLSEERRRSLWGDDYDKNMEAINKAITETDREVLVYNNEMITPCFHSVSTGKTRDAKEALGESYPYLVSVASADDVLSVDYMKISEFTIDEVVDILKDKNIEVNKEELFNQIQIIERDTLDYVKTVKINNSALSGDDFQKLFKLNSANFYIENYNGMVRFICKGKGNGIGFSQFGANVMAIQGKDYQTILEYYFHGTKVEER